MDRLPDSGEQQSTAGPSPSTPPNCSGTHYFGLKHELMERLRFCAALDRRFAKAWFDELDMERTGNFGNIVEVGRSMYTGAEWSGGTSAQDESSREASEAACQWISFEMQDLEDREKILTKHVEALSRQYEDLMDELGESDHGDIVLLPDRAVPRNCEPRPAPGGSDIRRIAAIVSAKENEQESNLYHLRHWDLSRRQKRLPGQSNVE
ncbi:uncharacterized protein EMH_0098770 [Eimeria mitis]|uniref:Uncharacterized protein n=1 Tax=Eimeria mitis TaxID=44415 RepID=U6JS72_9EIME|nr:uncharacterized protein EMH_0098770 [Eimeria mitis]CDJ26897.1 hypothetical protein, conserved [Eimeria mitis]